MVKLMPRQLFRTFSIEDGIGRLFANGRGWRVQVTMLSAICLAGLVATATHGQVGTGVQLEAPILPEPMMHSAAAPVPTGTPAGSFHAGVINGSHVATPMLDSSIAPGVVQASHVGCTSCGSIACTGCDDCGPGYQCPPGLGLWLRADYLIWYEKNMDTIPLATTTTADPATAGADYLTLAGAETSVLFGGRGLNADPLEGWRLEIGTWLDPSATFGIFGRYYEVGDREHTFRTDSTQVGSLGIPFFNFDTNSEQAFEVVVPTEREGLMAVEIDGGFRAWEILFRRLAQTGCNYRMDWVYGYRNTRLYDSLGISATTDLLTQVGLFQEDTVIVLNDHFDVKNQFHGFDFGVTGHSQEGNWSLDFLLKVALGVVDQEITVDGNTTIFGPAPDRTREVLVGGLFSQETNIGRHDNNEFGVIPEFNINLGYAVTPNVDFTVGYTFIYINSVVRAGTAIDRVVDEGLLSDLDPINSNRPQVNFEDTSYHIQGLNLGITARF